MTKEEAQNVTDYCYRHELRRPAAEEHSPHWYVLTWRLALGGKSFCTANYESARHWCMVMKYEHEDDVPGYWEAA